MENDTNFDDESSSNSERYTRWEIPTIYISLRYKLARKTKNKQFIDDGSAAYFDLKPLHSNCLNLT